MPRNPILSMPNRQSVFCVAILLFVLCVVADPAFCVCTSGIQLVTGVPNAQVALCSAPVASCVNSALLADTDSSGTACIGYSGSYYLLLIPPAGSPYAIQWYGGNTAGTATFVTIPAYPNLITLTETPVLGGTISGSVKDIAGTPIKDVEVLVFDNSGFPIVGMVSVPYVYTDATGFYTTPPLMPGIYTVQFNTDLIGGYSSQWYNGEIAANKADQVTVVTSQTTPNINATLWMSGTVFGWVTDKTNAAIRNATVTISCDTDSYSATTTTDINGRYSINSVPPGNCKVHFVHPTNSLYIDQWYNNKASEDAADTVEFTGVLNDSVKVNAVLDGQLGPNTSDNGLPYDACPQDQSNAALTCSCQSPGSPTWFVNKVNMNLYVVDTPLWYKPAIGPSVNLKLSYNSQTDASTPSPFGKKWIFNYGSSLTVGTNGNVTVSMPDGKRDIYKYISLFAYGAPFGVFNNLTKTYGQTNQYQLRFLDDTVYVYDIPQSSGLTNPSLTKIIDPHGLSLIFGYTSGKLATITDALGQVTTLVYGTNSLTVTDPFGRSAVFAIDPSGNLVSATDMGGYATTYAYDTSSYLTGITTPKGTWVFKIEPSDSATNPLPYPDPNAATPKMGKYYRITITDLLFHSEEYFYTGTYTQYVSPRDYIPYVDQNTNNLTSAKKTTYTVDTSLPKSKIATRTTPEGNTQQYTYDPATWNVMTLTDGNGHTVKYSYSTLTGLITNFWDAKTATTSTPTMAYSYYPNGVDVQTVTDGLGTVNYQYNGTHDITSIVDRMGITTTLTYDSYGRPTSVTEATGVLGLATTTSFNYNPIAYTLNQIWKANTLMGSFDYDPIGRISSATYADGVNITYQYERLNQLKQTNYPDGRSEQILNSTSCPFLVDSVTDRAGRTTSYSYDALKRLTQKTGPFGTFNYGYDYNSNLTTFTDAGNRVTTFGYDFDNRLKQKTYADSNFVSYAYYPNGLLNIFTNGRKQTITYLYDANNNMTNINYSDSTPAVTLHYDPYNRPNYRIDGIGTFNYGYDADSRLLTVQYPWDTAATITYGYNALGQLKTMAVLGSQAIAYGYDSIGRLANIQRGSDVPYTYSYDSDSSPLTTTLVRPSGSYTVYEHNDPLKKLTGIYNKTAGNTINSYAYTYTDPTHPDLINTETVTNGTLIDNFVNGTTSYDYGTNKVNQLQGIPSAGEIITHDLDGNMIQGYTPGGHQMTLGYDAENRLTLATDSVGNQTTNYYYSGDGVLTRVTKSGAIASDTRYVRSGLLTVQERDGSNNLTREYIWGKDMGGGIGGLLNIRQGGQDYSYLYDGKGNVTAMIDSGQNIVATYAYDDFGVLMKKTGTLNQPYMFSTKEYDLDTGLSYYGFRFYDATLGRWINRDPMGEAADANLYRAMRNNAVNLVDPEGLQSVPIIALPGMAGLPGFVNPGMGPSLSFLLDQLGWFNWFKIIKAMNGADSAILKEATTLAYNNGEPYNYYIYYGKCPVRFIGIGPAGEDALFPYDTVRVLTTIYGTR